MSNQLAKKYSNITWTEVDSPWFYEGQYRLDGSFYCGDIIKARLLLGQLNSNKLEQYGNCWMLNRYKKVGAEGLKNGVPFFAANRIVEAKPLPDKYVNKSFKHLKKYFVENSNTLLITRSGTVGKVTIFDKRFEGVALSEDLLRFQIDSNELPVGYIYTYLRSWIGQSLLISSEFGSVISHIDPGHLLNTNIIVIDQQNIKKIHNDIMQAFYLREQANNLIDESQELFYKLLNLPKISKEDVQYLGDEKVKAWEINKFGFENRFDSSFFFPLADLAIKKLKESKYPVSTLADRELIEKVFIPGRFKRIYVNKEFGIPFLSGKNIVQIQPEDLKYLSRSKTKNLDNYIIKKGCILITCSGTIGRTALVTSEWNGWSATQHILRVVPKNINTGYLYVFLSSDYGQVQIKRFIHGSVVDEITDSQIKQVVISIPDSDIQKQIGEKAQKAFELRAKANEIEEKAIEFLEKKIKESV